MTNMPDKTRNLNPTPEARVAVIIWGAEYAAQGGGKLNPSGQGWHTGPGHWTRANGEDCLLFTKGSPARLERGVKELVVAPRGDHSAKPPEVHGRIETLLPGPYLELFGRGPRAGWTVWGNQSGGG